MALSDMFAGEEFPQLDSMSMARLLALRPGLKSGNLDPGFAGGVVENTLAPYSQPPPQMDPTAALSALTGVASTNPNPEALSALSGALGSLGYDPQLLSSITSSLQGQGGMPSPLYQAPQGGAGGLDTGDYENLNTDIANAVQRGLSLEDTTNLIMQQVSTYEGVTPEIMQAVAEYVAERYQMMGGEVPEAPAPVPTAAPAQSGGNAGGLFSVLENLALPIHPASMG